RIFALLVLGATPMLSPSSAQPAATSTEIAAMPVGQPPPGFAFARTGGGPAGEWQVVTDASASGQKAIAQTSKDKTDYRFPLAIYQAVSAKNVEVTVRFK